MLAQNDSTIPTCQTATNARVGQGGVTYSGTLRNDDYQFEATIPKGLTGLGSDPNAPFHGFAIFPSPSACVVFDIQQVVVLPEDRTRARRSPGMPIKVDGRKAFEDTFTGTIRGRLYLNTVVQLELPRQGYKNWATIYFVTPLDERSTTEPIFRSFLASLRFW